MTNGIGVYGDGRFRALASVSPLLVWVDAMDFSGIKFCIRHLGIKRACFIKPNAPAEGI
jgi:hypothetical protein